MEVIFIQPNPKEVHFYVDNVKIASVINANVIFWPDCDKVIKNWAEKDWLKLSTEMAPHIAKML